MKQLRENLKGFCFTCKMRLIVPTWKYCQKCDTHRVFYLKQAEKRLQKQIHAFTLENFKDVTKLYTIHDHIKNKNLHDKRVLVYDENNVIIGYK